ncbi:MAG TPA: DNA cytosine methyltransferase [Candidatus Angelobacter sp.]|nr:DNA cytosine methyltransferase [Candidatus Angelobacter sp.]
MANDNKFYLSFFSGALGLDLGLEKAGLIPLAVNEFDPKICETIRVNRPNLRLYDFDIRRLNATLLCRDLGIDRGELFAIVGGPPCQAFSTAGRRLGLNDDRGNVFLHFIKLILDLQPKYAIFENVRGLLSAPLQHRPHDMRGPGCAPLTLNEKPGGALLHILDLLEGGGYSTTFTLYNSANYGVPQIRERLIFFASRDGAAVPFIPPTHNEKGRDNLAMWRTVRDAIQQFQKRPGECGQFPEKRLKYFKMLKAGQNWKDLPSTIQRTAMGESWYANGGKTGFYRRLSWGKPSPTLVTRPTMPATALCHPKELRPLSVREYAAIQTFPEDHAFVGNVDDKYKQIGNAVPPLFGEAIGKHIIQFDAGKLTETRFSQRFSRYVRTDHESWRASIDWGQRKLFI